MIKGMVEWIRWMLSSLLKAIFDHLATVIVLAVSSLISIVGPLFWKGTVFFTTEYPLSGWVISLSAIIFLTAILMNFFLFRRELRQKQRRKRTFICVGFEWVLLSGFWDNYETLTIDSVGTQFLNGYIRGPFCPRCKRDVTSVIKNHGTQCADCNKEFPLKGYGGDLDDNLHILIKTVYIEAQAAARRNEI